MTKIYSVVEHLAKTLLLSSWQGSVWVFMSEASAAYFDESRVDGSAAFPVVAGFCGPIDIWVRCDKRLRVALRNKPPQLKAKKYIREHPVQFAGIIKSLALIPIYTTLEQKCFESSFHGGKSAKDPMLANAYTLCGSNCFLLLHDYADCGKRINVPIQVVFDDGAPHKIQLERSYRKFVSGVRDKILSDVPHFSTEEETLPLLTAELYAWLLSRRKNGEQLTFKERKALRLIETAYRPRKGEISW